MARGLAHVNTRRSSAHIGSPAHRARAAAVLIMVASIGWGGCGQQEVAEPPPAPRTYSDVPSCSDFLQTRPLSTHLGEPYYLFESDITVGVDDFATLTDYYRAYYDLPPREGFNDAQAQALVVNVDRRGRQTIWDAQQRRDLSYCVSSNFASRRARVIAVMETATRAWEAVADLRFRRVDSARCERGVIGQHVFAVKLASIEEERELADVGILGYAFLPSIPSRERRIVLFRRAFEYEEGLIDTVLHELGHALGFRHEFVVDAFHSRPEPDEDDDGASPDEEEDDDSDEEPDDDSDEEPDDDRCFEDPAGFFGRAVRLSDGVDPYSIMNYDGCLGRPESSFVTELSEGDAAGAAKVYGAPAEPSDRLPEVPSETRPPEGTPMRPGDATRPDDGVPHCWPPL